MKLEMSNPALLLYHTSNLVITLLTFTALSELCPSKNIPS